MAQRSIIQYTTGTPGTGKSYLRCPVFLINEFLPESKGVHWSNFPVGLVNEDHLVPPKHEGETFAERIAAEVAKNTGGEAEDYERRIRTIPAEELARWENDIPVKVGDKTEMRPESGPWEFFKDEDLAGAHIAIDECHNFIGRKHSKKHREMWQQWLGEIRHQGATVEFLSQSHMKVAKEVGYEAALRRTLESTEDLRPPFLGFPLKEWYNIKAKFTRRYTRMVIITEKVERNEKWVNNHREMVLLRPHYYQFYNSFNTPQKGGKAGKLEKQDWEKYSLLKLIMRLPARYPIAIGLRFALVAFIVFLFMGGGKVGVVYMIERIGGVSTKNANKQQADPASTPVASSAFASAVASPQQQTNRNGTPVVFDQPGETVAGITPLQETPDAELQAARTELEALRNAVDEFKSKASDASAVVLLTPDEATMRDGYSYGVGELIDFGPYAGRTIVRIEYDRRAVYLDDGLVLRLGRVSAAGEDRPPAGLPGHVQPGQGEPAGAGDTGEHGNTPDPLGEGHAPGALPAVGGR